MTLESISNKLFLELDNFYYLVFEAFYLNTEEKGCIDFNRMILFPATLCHSLLQTHIYIVASVDCFDLLRKYY